MGNHRFRLSDMMPNAWFYKLRDMRKPNNQNPTKSFYDQTIKPSAKPTRRKAIYMPSTRKDANLTIFAAAANEVRAQSDDHRISRDDIIINIDDNSLHLPPIVTKPATKQSPLQKSPQSFEMPKEDGAVRSKETNRKSGVKIRANRNGRKFAGKKPESGGRKSVKREKRCLFYSESFALVKSSFDPERDFKDSMIEMIVENRIRELKDLQDLLACYLSLNSNRYHDVIIRAFEQIWFAMKD